MDSQEILRALQAGEISTEDAKKELIKMRKGVPKPSSEPHPSELSLQYDTLKPEDLGNPIFQKRNGCKWNYFSGSMCRGVASEQLVIAMAKSHLLSFFGSAGLRAKELERRIQSLQSRLSPDTPYGMCLISNLYDPEEELQQVELFLRYHVPVIEAAAFVSITLPLVYCRIKGLHQQGNTIIFPRRIIAKCSRLEVARFFLAPPAIDIVDELFTSGMISEEEAKLSQHIPLADDLAVEADSGGHTDQGVAFSLLPSVIALKEQFMQQYHYQDEILAGCGGGLGTPQAVASAFMLGADFIFTGSINQCTVESGAHDVVKDLLSTITIHDTAIAPDGDMFETGAKVQVVKKTTQFVLRANKLYQLSMQYHSIEEIPHSIRQEIEARYFKRTFSDVWDLVCEDKSKKNPEQLQEAKENPRMKMALIFKWYFAHSIEVTLHGDESEKDNFQIYCGPALGSFNQWVQGTQYEHWKDRHVDKIAELLMCKAL